MPVKCDYDKGRLQAWLRQQGGVIARWQVLECGLTSKALDYRLRPGGQWQRVLPGVYLAETGSVSAEQREIAALLYAGQDSVLTGAMAVRRHRVECAGLNIVDVLIPAREHRQSTDFVHILRTTKMPDDVYRTGAVRFAPPPRAVADAARMMKRFDDVRAVVSSALQRSRCTFQSLAEELEHGPSAGSRHLSMALTEVSDGARSNAEITLHKLIDSSDLEKPLYNAEIWTRDGTFIAKADAWWQRAGVAGEVDSRQYHFKASDYRDTQLRHNRMERYGVLVQHWLPSVIHGESRRVLDDLDGALAAGYGRPPLPFITKVNGVVVPIPEDCTLGLARQ
jgi:hypothetical protein